MPKKAGLFRSPNSLFELNAGDFLLREPAKFSVWRIPGTREFRGERSKIRVSPFRKRRKMPPYSWPPRTRRAPSCKNAVHLIAFQVKRHQTMSKSAQIH